MSEAPGMMEAQDQISAFQSGMAEMPAAPEPQPEPPAQPPATPEMPDMPQVQEEPPAFQPDTPDMPAMPQVLEASPVLQPLAPESQPEAQAEQSAMSKAPGMMEAQDQINAFQSGMAEIPAAAEHQPVPPAEQTAMSQPAQAAQMLRGMAQTMRAAQPGPEPDAAAPPAEGAGAPRQSPAPAPATGDAGAGSQAVAAVSSEQFTAMARDLLDVMGMPDSAAQPQERALAASALLPLIGHVSARFHRELTDRLCIMEHPPLALVRAILGLGEKALEEKILLEARLPERFMLEAIRHDEESKIHLITRRRNLTTAMSAAIVSHGTVQDILELLRNDTARLDEGAFWKIAAKARKNTILHAPFATHKDLPPAVAFAAFWYLPPTLRRFVMSRFLVDSGVLGRILRIALPKKPPCDPQDRIMRIETMIELMVEGNEDAARAKMTRLTGLDEAACARIIEDSQGEAMTVLLKALGYGRSLFGPIIQRLAESPMAALDKERNLEELQNTFAALSHDKAWELLLYWHWQARNDGPYEGQNGAI